MRYYVPCVYKHSCLVWPFKDGRNWPFSVVLCDTAVHISIEVGIADKFALIFPGSELFWDRVVVTYGNFDVDICSSWEAISEEVLSADSSVFELAGSVDGSLSAVKTWVQRLRLCVFELSIPGFKKAHI